MRRRSAERSADAGDAPSVDHVVKAAVVAVRNQRLQAFVVADAKVSIHGRAKEEGQHKWEAEMVRG